MRSGAQPGHSDAWERLHAIVANDQTTRTSAPLARYRRLWVIEKPLRTLKRGLALWPVHHFKPERLAAHTGLCYLAFALTRRAQQQVKLAQTAMNVQRGRPLLQRTASA